MQSTINVYLSFDGVARQAMEFYQNIFGGELELRTFGDAHVEDQPSNGIMHAVLRARPDFVIMASDGMDDGAKRDGFAMALGGENAEELRGYFEKLSDGADVFMPLRQESWGDEFGMLTDKFGVKWMVNISQAQE